MASANSKTITVASGATGPSTTGYPLPFQSFSTYTFLVSPTGGASVAIQGSIDGTTWVALTSMGAITAAGWFQWSTPLPFVRFVVSGGGSATISWCWGDNR